MWDTFTLGARGFLREEPRSTISEAVKREKIDKRWENLWLPATVVWSYRSNRFELGSRSDHISWLEEHCSVLWLAVVTDRCVVIGCLLTDSCDTYRSMLVRFASPVTRGFLSLLLSLGLLSSRWKETSGNREGISLFHQTFWSKNTAIDSEGSPVSDPPIPIYVQNCLSKESVPSIPTPCCIS